MGKPYTIQRAIELASALGMKIWASHPGPASAAHAAVPGADLTYTDDGDEIDIWGDTPDGQRFNIGIILTGPDYKQLAITRSVRDTAVGLVQTGTTDRAEIERVVASRWGLPPATVASELNALISSGGLPHIRG